MPTTGKANMEHHPESLLISALLNTQNVLQAEELGITTGHIHEYKAEYEWLVEHKLKYKTEPSLSDFKSIFPTFDHTDTVSVEYSVDRVKELHLRWVISKSLRDIAASLKSGDVDQALDTFVNQGMKISQGIEVANSYTFSNKDYSESMDWALARSASVAPSGAPFAHPTIQERTLGMQGGDLWIKAARLGQGKTWDLINDACASLISGQNVLFFSLEMNRRQMEARFQTVLGHHYGYAITNDQISKGRNLDLREYKEMLGEISDKLPGNYMVIDRRRGRVNSRTIAALTNKYTPDLVVVDYMGLMTPAGKTTYSQAWENVAQVVDEVKDVACQFDVPILSAAQINREGERGSWRPPKAVHLAGSDSLGRDADCVITMKRFGKGAMVYSLEKNRHGQSGDLWFARFNPNIGDFTEISRAQAEALREAEGDFEEDL